MAYTPQQWHDDTTDSPYGPISGDRLNYIEAGIAAAAGTADAALAAAGSATSTPLGTAAPIIDGAAAAGSSGSAAHEDHVHPTDTSRAALASPTFTGTPAAPTASAATSTTQLATTAFVTTADNLKANLAAPTFTGAVVLPTGTTGVTQSAADNSTKLATTAYADTGLALKANLAGPTFTGSPVLPTGTTGVTQAATDSSTALATTAFVMGKEQAFTLSIGGVITPTMADSADFNFCVPWNCTILRMKATVKAAVTGACAVQLRSSAQPITTAPAFSNVTGFVCTFSASNVLAVVDPANADFAEGDFLGLSVTVGSGVNLFVEVVAVKR